VKSGVGGGVFDIMAEEDGMTSMLICISEDDSSNRSTEITNCAKIRRNVGLQYRISVIGDDRDVTTDCPGFVRQHC